MNIISNVVFTLKESVKRKTHTCQKCGKVFHNKKENFNICNECEYLITIDASNKYDSINKMKEDINRGFKNIDAYLSRYKIILDEYKTLYEYAQYVPDKIQLKPDTFEELKTWFNKDIRKLMDEKNLIITKKMEVLGKYKIEKQYNKLVEQAIELSIEYPDFEEGLTFYK
ncbi:MAG: hypothetical protein PHN72_03940 [Bacilli bacterium]|nr:hypothetical protein [Bacilli bacterium]